jgi:hypothetical protein
LALACFFFIFAVKAFTALAISASAFAASAAFAALAFAAISTARALALAILIFALTAAALAAALRAALAAAPADLLLTADLALAAAFFADAAFFRAAFAFLVAAFASFCNFASAAFALDKALDPQENGKQAINDFTQARKDYKKRTGKDLNLNVRVELEGEGMQGKAAEVEKNGDTWNVVIDAGKYHKGIFGHELAHVFGETFNMNDPEGLKEITKFVGKTVNENLGVDFKGLIEKLYKGKQIEELNPEEYLAGIIEVLGAGGKGDRKSVV